jgi:polyhydroxyalkanoate synthesis regulator protein
MAKPAAAATVKRYAQARLYDVEAARYVTAQEVAEMIAGRGAVVRDAATGEDLTAAYSPILLPDRGKP